MAWGKRAGWLWLLVVLVAGCASLRVRLHRLPAFALRPAADHPSTYSATVRVQGGAKPSFSFVAQVEVGAKGLVLVGVSSIGRRLFVLRLRNRSLRYQPSPGYRLPLPPSRLVAYLQLALWPRRSVERGWSAPHIQVTEQAGPPRRRVILSRGQPLLRIVYRRLSPQRTVMVVHPLREGTPIRLESYTSTR